MRFLATDCDFPDAELERALFRDAGGWTISSPRSTRGALLGSLPVAIMYSFFVEYYVAGMTGAVKE